MMTLPFLKRFVAWATDLTDKYRFNPFFKATVNVIFLQSLLALILVGIFAWGVEYAQTSTVRSISTLITEAITGGTENDMVLPASIAEVRIHTYFFVFLGLLLMTALFGYLTARFALRPAQRSLEFQKRFIGDVAHEIRTPLAIIKTTTEVALMNANLLPEPRRILEGTIVELDRISEIINNLLSFDILTRPRRLSFEPVDLSAIARTVIERHQALARTRGVELAGSIDSDIKVVGKATALDQAITNLVKNAINYTPEHKQGRVTVALARLPFDKVRLTVADTGIGIARKDLQHVLEPFYRGDTSRARGIGTGSSGLGLAIVNEIVRIHQGGITIRSTVGVGTEIGITLPAEKHEGLPDPLGSDTGTDTNEVSMDFS